MNEAFRKYVFGRSFNINLSEKHVEMLAALCKGDHIASYGLSSSIHGLIRRGLVDIYVDDANHRRFRPNRAGLLVYDLLVEAGEYAAIEEKRRETLDMEAKLHALEWEERFGHVTVALKDRFNRDASRRGDN